VRKGTEMDANDSFLKHSLRSPHEASKCAMRPQIMVSD
jgi:hypothetical protein